jgi:hypothetical protein
MDYKKYSLENLENWMHDAMSAGEASPQEIYDVIVGVAKENYYVYKQQASQAYELLELLNGNGKSITKEHYDGWDSNTTSNLVCDKDDPSPECQKSWNDFWEESEQYTEEELNAMCDKAASDQEKEKCREYNLREAEYYDKRAQLDADYKKSQELYNSEDGDLYPVKDKVVKWQLPVQVDGLTGDCFVEFPDDLLERAGFKEGDIVEWVPRGDDSFELRKVTKPLKMDEC